MHRHTSLREHLIARAELDHPVRFQPSNDPPLVEFARHCMQSFAVISFFFGV